MLFSDETYVSQWVLCARHQQQPYHRHSAKCLQNQAEYVNLLFYLRFVNQNYLLSLWARAWESNGGDGDGGGGDAFGLGKLHVLSSHQNIQFLAYASHYIRQIVFVAIAWMSHILTQFNAIVLGIYRRNAVESLSSIKLFIVFVLGTSKPQTDASFIIKVYFNILTPANGNNQLTQRNKENDSKSWTDVGTH